MAQPTRYTCGITTSKKQEPFGSMGTMDPTLYHMYHNDFDTYNATDWTITTTEAGAGSATEALTNEDGGVLLITNDDADDDADFFNLSAETFKFESNKKLVFKARLKISDATQSDLVCGLQITDTTPLAVSDGVFFQKDDGDTNLDFHVVKDSTATDTAAIATLADDTYVILAFTYDGKSEIKMYVNDVHVSSSVTTNLPDDEEMTISFGIQNGEAVAKTMSVDYITVVKER